MYCVVSKYTDVYKCIYIYSTRNKRWGSNWRHYRLIHDAPTLPVFYVLDFLEPCAPFLMTVTQMSRSAVSVYQMIEYLRKIERGRYIHKCTLDSTDQLALAKHSLV